MDRRSFLQQRCKISGKRLPSEYARVEYLESTGTQWIDPMFEPSKFTTINLRFNLFEFINDMGIFGAGISGSAETLFELSCVSDSRLRAGLTYGDRIFFPVSLGDNSLVFNDSQHRVYLNNNLVGTFTNYNNFQEKGQKILLFSSFNPPLSCIKIKLYSCQIFDNGSCVRNFVPALRLSDMKPGLYDMVNGQFYVNQGTGEFKYKILPDDYQQVEYIESTGTQYIDTGYKVLNTTTVACSFQYTAVKKNAVLFGTGVSGTISTGYLFSVDWDTTNRFYGQVANSLIFKGLDLQKHHVIINNNEHKFLYDNVEVGVFSDYYSFIGSNNPNLVLFSNGQINIVGNPGYSAKAKIFSAVILENDTPVRAFIPCYRKSDSEIGLYDLINRVFYTNQGTGTFLKGPDIN